MSSRLAWTVWTLSPKSKAEQQMLIHKLIDSLTVESLAWVLAAYWVLGIQPQAQFLNSWSL